MVNTSGAPLSLSRVTCSLWFRRKSVREWIWRRSSMRLLLVIELYDRRLPTFCPGRNDHPVVGAAPRANRDAVYPAALAWAKPGSGQFRSGGEATRGPGFALPVTR